MSNGVRFTNFQQVPYTIDNMPRQAFDNAAGSRFVVTISERTVWVNLEPVFVEMHEVCVIVAYRYQA